MLEIKPLSVHLFNKGLAIVQNLSSKWKSATYALEKGEIKSGH